MSFVQRFEQGFTYLGGANKPFVVSQARVKSWAEEHGFSNVVVIARSDLKEGVPFVTANDDWDTVIRADHLGPAVDLEVPGDRPAFLFGGAIPGLSPSAPPVVEVTPPPGPAPAPAPPATSSETKAAAALFAEPSDLGRAARVLGGLLATATVVTGIGVAAAYAWRRSTRR